MLKTIHQEIEALKKESKEADEEIASLVDDLAMTDEEKEKILHRRTEHRRRAKSKTEIIEVSLSPTR